VFITQNSSSKTQRSLSTGVIFETSLALYRYAPTRITTTLDSVGNFVTTTMPQNVTCTILQLNSSAKIPGHFLYVNWSETGLADSRYVVEILNESASVVFQR